MEEYGTIKEELRHLTATFPLAMVVEALEDVLSENDPDMLEWKIKIKVKCKKED